MSTEREMKGFCSPLYVDLWLFYPDCSLSFQWKEYTYHIIAPFIMIGNICVKAGPRWRKSSLLHFKRSYYNWELASSKLTCDMRIKALTFWDAGTRVMPPSYLRFTKTNCAVHTQGEISGPSKCDPHIDVSWQGWVSKHWAVWNAFKVMHEYFLNP